MAVTPGSKSKMFFIKGDADNYYAVPASEMEKYSKPLQTPQRKANFDNLVKQSAASGRALSGFHHDHPPTADSEGIADSEGLADSEGSL